MKKGFSLRANYNTITLVYGILHNQQKGNK